MSIDRRSLASLARRPTRRRSARRRVAAEAQRTLTEIAGGRLARLPVTLRFWDGSTLPGGPPVVEVRHRRAISHLLHHPNQLGLARAWVDGSLAVPDDPEDVLHTRKAFEGLELSAADRLRVTAAAVRIGGPGILRSPPVPSIEASVSGGRHSLTRDRQAVRHHYDVSNDFYRLLLGPTMVYSCAYFATEQDSLEQAQEQKLDLICRKLRLQPGESLLDLGCGWGSLLLHAAAHYGVRAVGVTLSEPQAALGAERIARQGLQDRVEIRVADYREVHDGPYDKIASVGMYEHVGHEMLDEYTGLVRRLLVPGGLFLNHGIARLHSPGPGRDAFTYRYIFPDGDLHPVSDLTSSLQRIGLEVRDVESLRDHYPLTLRRWLANLRANRDRTVGLVGAERERIWELYLLASAIGFEDADVTVYQVLATRPDGQHKLPLTRAQLLKPTPEDVARRGQPGAARFPGLSSSAHTTST